MHIDSRVQYLLNCFQSLFGLDYKVEKVENEELIDSFLNSNQVTSLKIVQEKNRVLALKINQPSNGSIIFLNKTSMEDINQNNISQIVSLTKSSSNDFLSHLYSQIKSLYIPMLQKSNDSQILRLMEEMKNNLDFSQQIQDQDNKNFQTPIDEIKYWIRQDRNEHAKLINEVFSKITKYWNDIEKLRYEELKEALDSTLEAIDLLWTKSEIYGEQDMAKLLENFSNQIILKLQQELKEVWSLASSQKPKLLESSKMLKNWNDKVQEFTGQIWPSEKKKWKGRQINNQKIQKLQDRILEIDQIQNQFLELQKLLTKKAKLDQNQAFQAFLVIDCFNVNMYTQSQWGNALKQFNEYLQVYEEQASQLLQQEIFSHKGSQTSLQILRDMIKWQGLLSRPIILQNLKNDRESIMDDLIQTCIQNKQEFDSRSGQSIDPILGMDSIPSDKFSSGLINKIQWVRQIQGKFKRILNSCQVLLGDLQKFQKLKQECSSSLAEIKDFESDCFRQWHDTYMQEIKNGNIALKPDGKLMELDMELGTMKVNYSDGLMHLIREFRQMTELGFKRQINKQIIDCIEIGKKFFKEALTLKQVANFYNSMDNLIIKSQKPMIVQQAVEFENTAKSFKISKNSIMTWDSTQDLEQYISKVQQAAENIISENRKLRKYHLTLVELVNQLFEIDYLKQTYLWKDQIEKIRKIIGQGQAGRDLKLCRQWRTHWDHQIYKALEFQYRKGLLELNLKEMKVDMSFQNKQVVFKPPIEEIKYVYYKEVKNFVNMPLTFLGVDGDSVIYKDIPEKNSKFLQVIYTKSEEIFFKLNEFLKGLRPWTAIAYMDLSNLNQKLKKLDDWELNLKQLKQKRKQSQDLQDYIKIECFNINQQPLKEYLDDRFSQIIEQIIQQLKQQVKSDLETVEKFVVDAMDQIQKKPQSMKEIMDSKDRYLQLKQKRDEVLVILKEAEDKNRILKSTSGGGLNVQQVQSHWDNFEVAVGDFDNIVQQQQDQIKSMVQTRMVTMGSEVDRIYQKWLTLKPKNQELNRELAKEQLANLEQWKIEWDEKYLQIQELQNDCKLFGLPQFDQKIITKIQDELEKEQQGWMIFKKLDNQLIDFEKQPWIVFRNKLTEFQDFTMNWIEHMKINKKNDSVTLFILQQLDLFNQIFPLLKLMIGESFEKLHWKQLFQILKLQDAPLDELTFGEILDQQSLIVSKQNEIKELSSRAIGEVSVKEAIQELKIWLESSEFDLKNYQSLNRTTPLIKEWKDLMTKVSDNQSLLASLKDSKYSKRFQDSIEQIENKIFGLDDSLQKLNIIQRKWVYLEPIFNRGALPKEQSRFRRIDDEYRQIMLNISKNPKIVNFATIAGLRETLETQLMQLDQCQKALNEYLEEKRNKFSRFYFLGDDDLLEILGQSKNPEIIQQHLKKLFAGIQSVVIQDGHITKMQSLYKEVVEIEKVEIKEEVEIWMQMLVESMQSTLKDLLKKSLSEQSLQMDKYPSQILSLGEQIRFCNQAQNAILSKKLTSFKNEQIQTLQQFTKLQKGANQLLQIKLKSLILDLIHNIDVVDQLIKNNTQDLNDWNWLRQLKYEIKQQANILMCRASFDYTYEYQGNAPKLVHTPLTDKCYLTLTQAMQMGYGGNPYGPAGTGKTESVKALAQAFGRQCLVFNCDEGLDFKSMGRIFLGLVKCGAWGCFDEFNRLLEDQLSAISQQIQIIQFAIKEKQETLDLLGTLITVNKNAGIFVTLNPAGKGYGGRSKLPDNLKQLFRPVAMSVPDNELIAETLLFSEGFTSAKILAKKIVAIFILSRQLLTQQQHYDWGLRALKTILTVSGELIQQSPDQEEALLLIKAIRINTMSKLTFQDGKRFEKLLNDVFPGVECQDIQYPELTKAIEKVFEEMKIQNVQQQVNKILQFYEATKQRIGVVLVGPSGCGKTTIWKILKRAKEILGQPVQTYIMNPKSMPRSQLLGHMNNDIREFTEGVLTYSARLVVKESQDVQSWIICDGDIDPEWIESLNSVLDDNHLLTLPTGERISFGNNVNFIFETADLQYASPATVSRMGMIFLNNEDLPIQAIVNKWLLTQQENNQLEQFMQNHFYTALQECQKYEQYFTVQTTRLGTVRNALSLLEGCQNEQELIEGLIKGFCSNLDSDRRPELAKTLMKLLNVNINVDPQNPLDFVLNRNQFQQIQFQNEKFGDFTDQNKPPIVSTVELQRNKFIISKWVSNCEPFIIVGPEGCGKNVIMRNSLDELKKNIKIQVVTIHCNAQTQASQIIQKLNQVCLKANNQFGRIFKPKDCGRLIIYIKDINLPKPDKYQTIQLIAFLQQMITHKGFYDDNLEFIQLDDKIQILSTMNPASTIGRHQISTRFTANVRILNVDYPKSESLVNIFSLYQDRKDSKQVSEFLVELYSQIKQEFSVDEQRHYLFTPKNLTQIIYQLNRYEQQDDLEVLYFECSKSFKDRIVSQQGKQKFDNLINRLMQNYFKVKPVGKMFTILTNIANKNAKLSEIKQDDYQNLIKQGLFLYQRDVMPMKFIILDEMMTLLNSLDRILSQSESSLLLAGRSGSSRKSCIQLIAQMMRFELFSPQITKDYGIREFKKDLKGFFEIATVQNKNIILFIEDYQLVKPDFLEILNSLISSGEVQGLYTNEEIDQLFSNSDDLKQEYYGMSLYEGFCQRLKKNIRIVISLNHQQSNFNQNCAQNPALITKCKIIWLDSLSDQSFQMILQNDLKDMIEDPKMKQKIFNQFLDVHKSVNYEVMTTKNYYNLIETFKHIFQEKKSNQGSQTSHLKSGLSKLNEANQLVDALSKEAVIKSQELSVKQKEADQALTGITLAMKNADERKIETQRIKEFMQQEEKNTTAQEEQVSRELANIQPLVDEAMGAVGSISKTSLDEIKNLRMPPEAIHDVLNAVLRLFGNQDTTWNSMKKFLSNKGVIDQVLNFNPKNITPELYRELSAFISKKSSSFDKQSIFRASQAAGPLAIWVQAILQYSQVLIKIQPLTSQLENLRRKLQESKERLRICESDLMELDQKVTDLKTNFQSKTSEAEILKQSLHKAQLTLDSAQSLIGKLGDEKIRWQDQINQIDIQLKMLPSDSLLSAGFIVYLCGKDENNRSEFLNGWKQKINNDKFTFLRFMINESQILKNKALGLPGDQLSIENSVMVFNSQLTAFMIDPNTQATKWLETVVKPDVLNSQDPKFTNSVELAVRFGKTLVIKELDKIDPVIFPLIRRDFFQQGPRLMVKIGDKMVDYNQDFKVYLCTRNSDLNMTPSEQGLLNIINFTVTRSGLEGKLLSIIINYEQPELEQKKSQYLQQEEDLKIQLSELEKNLLESLASSKGNILENIELIKNLNETKIRSNEIKDSLIQSHQLQENLDQQREVYRQIAMKGAILYIYINDLQKVNNMYRFSLALFIKIFNKSLNIKLTFSNIQEKLEYAQQFLYRNILDDLGISLFKQDRMLFALHIVRAVYPEKILENEWNYFMGAIIQCSEQQLPNWVPKERKQNMVQLVNCLPQIGSLLNNNQWEQWMDTLECENNIPIKLSQFQKVILIQTLRPDRSETALNNFLCEVLQINSINGSAPSFQNLYENESSPQTPILFITSQGSDPSKELEEFASSKIGRDNFKVLSMGGNQNNLAIQMIKEAAQNGNWVCLNNIHLVNSWLPTLEKELKSLDLHQNFRLWLTTEPHLSFPAILLETCYKVTYEAPPGIKKNISRIFQSWTPEFFQQGTVQRSQLLFIIALFQAILQERRIYIPQGWTKFYEFSYTDLKSGTIVIDGMLQKEGISWQTLYGIFINAIYGGRIDNETDLKVLDSYLKFYFNNDVLTNQAKVLQNIAVPQSKNYNDFIALINKLNEVDLPQFFGLPQNIDKALQRFNIIQLLDRFKIINRNNSDLLRFQKEIWADFLRPVIENWKNLKKQINIVQVTDELLESEDPLDCFVATELQLAYSIIDKVDNSIQNISDVLYGNGFLTTQIQQEAKELIQQNVPIGWQFAWEGPNDLNQWIVNLFKKTKSLKNWYSSIQRNNLLQQSLKLSDLFHTEIFLNALRQKTSRHIKIPIDDMKLIISFEEGIIQQNNQVKVEGLFLQGCGFDRNQLIDPKINLPEFYSLPVAYLAWVSSNDRDPYNANQIAELPLYFNPLREKVLTNLKIKNQGSQQDRILSGSALFLTDEN